MRCRGISNQETRKRRCSLAVPQNVSDMGRNNGDGGISWIIRANLRHVWRNERFSTVATDRWTDSNSRYQHFNKNTRPEGLCVGHEAGVGPLRQLHFELLSIWLAHTSFRWSEAVNWCFPRNFDLCQSECRQKSRVNRYARPVKTVSRIVHSYQACPCFWLFPPELTKLFPEACQIHSIFSIRDIVFACEPVFMYLA